MAKSNVINGSDMCLWLGGKPIAYASSCSLSLSADATDISNKDEGNGWKSSVISSRSWECTTSNMYAETPAMEGEVTFATLFDAYKNGTELELTFGVTQNAAATERKANITDYTEGWKPSGSFALHGKCIVTSLSATGDNGSNGTFECTLTGVGEIKTTA